MTTADLLAPYDPNAPEPEVPLDLGRTEEAIEPVQTPPPSTAGSGGLEFTQRLPEPELPEGGGASDETVEEDRS